MDKEPDKRLDQELDIYLVGGAVRDRRLGIPHRERDWVVVGARPEDLLQRGFTPADPHFPVFYHPESGEEYALARRESKTGFGYKGFQVSYGPDVTLEEDLARRDLRINAMAEDRRGHLIDPYGGLEDLQQGRLHHITPAFVEDPVRLLRIARFAAKLGDHGFRVAHATQALLRDMAAGPDLTHLKPERIGGELQRALAEPQPWRFLEVLHRAGALGRLLPELAPVLDPQLGAAGHGAVPPLSAGLQRLRRHSTDPRLHFAAAFAPLLLAARAAPETLATRLRPPRPWLELVRQLLAHLTWQETRNHSPAALLERLEASQALRDPGRLDELLLLATALRPQQGAVAAARLTQALTAARTVDPAAEAARCADPRQRGPAIQAARLAAIHTLSMAWPPCPPAGPLVGAGTGGLATAPTAAWNGSI